VPDDRPRRVHRPFSGTGGSVAGVSMSWLWLLPASAVLTAVGVTAVQLRRVADEATALQRSLARWDRMAVAVGDLEHDAYAAERNLRGLRSRRLTRR
jgi:hypothetical protein